MVRTIFANHGRLLAVEACVGAVVNSFIALGISWATFHPAVLRSRWGAGGYGPDAIISSFLPIFMISLLAGLAHRGRVAKGKLPALPRAGQAHALHAGWLYVMPLRALLVALLLTPFLAPLLIGAVAVVGPARLDFASYLAIKVAHGALIGAVCGVIALGWALIDSASPRRGGTPHPNPPHKGEGESLPAAVD